MNSACPRTGRRMKISPSFFSVHVKELDGQPVYGHMDYGKKDPSLGWRFTDCLAVDGRGRVMLACRMDCRWTSGAFGSKGADQRVSSVARGGATNSPAAVYALGRYMDWLARFAPPEASGMTFSEAGPVPAQGQIAQQIFWYTTFTADMIQPGLAVMNDDGTPKWRMAPSPHGPYWQEGMKLGYQDTGSWTFPDQHTARTAQGRLALCPVCRLENRVAQKDAARPDADSRFRSAFRGHDRCGTPAGWSCRVLSEPRAGRLDPNRYECARLPGARAIVVG